MPSPLAIAGIGLGAKALSSLLGGRSKKKQEKSNKQAATNAANIQQKQREDQRRARLQLGNSLLGGVPQTTGGGVRTNVALDPAVFADLNRERTYDFGSAIPESAGGVEAFLSGLFGDVADFIPHATAAGAFGPEAQAAGQQGSFLPGNMQNGAITIEQLLELLGLGGGRSGTPPPAGPPMGPF